MREREEKKKLKKREEGKEEEEEEEEGGGELENFGPGCFRLRRVCVCVCTPDEWK